MDTCARSALVFKAKGVLKSQIGVSVSRALRARTGVLRTQLRYARGATHHVLTYSDPLPKIHVWLRAHYGTSGTVRVPNLDQGPTASSM